MSGLQIDLDSYIEFTIFEICRKNKWQKLSFLTHFQQHSYKISNFPNSYIQFRGFFSPWIAWHFEMTKALTLFLKKWKVKKKLEDLWKISLNCFMFCLLSIWLKPPASDVVAVLLLRVKCFLKFALICLIKTNTLHLDFYIYFLIHFKSKLTVI